MNRRHLTTFVCLTAAALVGLPTGLLAKEAPLPAALPAFGPDKPLPVPAIQESTLANGLTVWLLPRPGMPRVAATLAVRGGTASDPAGLEGTAEIFAGVLKEGTKTRSSQQLAEQFQGIGGQIDATTNDDAVLVTANSLSSGTSRMLELLADVAINPTFPDAEVELAKANALQGLAAAMAQPEFWADETFARAVFGEHPYRITHASEAAIGAVTAAGLREQHLRRFRPERALLIVAGAFDAKAVAKDIAKRFGRWKASGEAVALPGPAPRTYARKALLVDRPDSIQSTVRVGRPSLKVSDPDYYRLLVANTIYGGSFGSRLTQNIREDKGYTYSPGSAAQTFAEGGLFATNAAVRTEVTAASLMEIFYELDRVGTTTVGSDELARAKRYQTGLYLLRNQITGAVVGTLVGNWIKGLPPQALSEFVAKVDAVTADDVQRLGRTMMRSRDQIVVVGGDRAKIAESLQQFGDFEVVTPAP
jgi:predicted Zn-dependent peptidase